VLAIFGRYRCGSDARSRTRRRIKSDPAKWKTADELYGVSLLRVGTEYAGKGPPAGHNRWLVGSASRTVSTAKVCASGSDLPGVSGWRRLIARPTRVSSVRCPCGSWPRRSRPRLMRSRGHAVRRHEQHLLALLVRLKCYQRLGYFAKLADVLHLPQSPGAGTGRGHRLTAGEIFPSREGLAELDEHQRHTGGRGVGNAAVVCFFDSCRGREHAKCNWATCRIAIKVLANRYRVA
jgi:hypothetical protein